MQENEQVPIPELWMIQEIVRQHLPEGHTLSNVDLSIGSVDEDDRDQEPRFLVLVDLKKEADAPEPFGWANKMAKVIRQKWPKDEFDLKVKIIMA